MPIYEYVCQKCGHHLEELQKVSDQPLCDCPACGAPKLERVISHTSFHLKGGGWYETDYKKKPAASENKSASETPTKTEDKSDKGTKE